MGKQIVRFIKRSSHETHTDHVVETLHVCVFDFNIQISCPLQIAWHIDRFQYIQRHIS